MDKGQDLLTWRTARLIGANLAAPISVESAW